MAPSGLRRRQLLGALAGCGMACAVASPLHAQEASELLPLSLEEALPPPVERRHVTLRQQPDGSVALSAELPITLPRLVEEALYQGVPIYFVQEAEVLRERWYWTDRQETAARRYLRLSYQPLTRRWRLAVSDEPFASGSLGSALARPFLRLEDALSVMQRVGHWRIAEPGVLQPAQRYTLVLSFRLDWSHLPRPLQIGAIGRSEWNVSHSFREAFSLEGQP